MSHKYYLDTYGNRIKYTYNDELSDNKFNWCSVDPHHTVSQINQHSKVCLQGVRGWTEIISS